LNEPWLRVRVVRVRRDDHGTWCWRVNGDGKDLCKVELHISARRWPLDTYRILTADSRHGWLFPREVSRGTFDRVSLWWTAEVLRDVLETIVRQRIAPEVTEITVDLDPS
jgi:hypothetical protein